MNRVHPTSVPEHSLLQRYSDSGAYVDCYATEFSARASHAQFVEAFYTTPLFKLERFLLGAVASCPSTDAQAKELAQGQRESFAAWQVESRASNEVLLRAGRTRSWLMVAASPGSRTRLLFGSAVLPKQSTPSGHRHLGGGFRALLGFHKLYSRALLLSARLRLSRQLT
ncbi:MAG TPA: hypothetical protein VHM00_08735 [Caldimonas sp.]|jgi:hypothetical protein|nr:hypothetical protein [Caldimonas sp.]HEX2541154.1 hypothetical protein [Caldimonas sp.]